MIPDTPPEQDGLPVPLRYWSMLAIGLGITMAVLDSSVANIALPTIAHQLQVAPARSIWVVNAYQLVIVVSLLPLAALGERIGYRRVYQAGLMLFTAGSLACALSHSLPLLVAARIAQGLGAGGIMSVNGALVRYTYPRALLGRGVGLNALVVSLSAAAGPSLASAVLAVGSWEWLFAINVPIGLLAIVVSSRALPWSQPSGERFDRVAAALNLVMFGGVFVGIDRVAEGGWLTIAVGIAAGIVLVRREAGKDRPLIPIDLLRLPVFALSVVASVCAFAAYMLVFLALPFHFETALHLGQVRTGLLMTPWPVALGMIGPFAGRLSDRVSPALLGAAGLSLLTAGLVLLASLPTHATSLDIVWRMALCGLGFGLFQAPNNRVLLSTAPRARSGAAGGMLATARLAGMTIGATIVGLAFRLSPASATTIDLSIGAGLAIVAMGASLSRWRPANPAFNRTR
jgi:DHA2 family multidrug resistance protein-like MFS transporter